MGVSPEPLPIRYLARGRLSVSAFPMATRGGAGSPLVRW